MIYRAKSKFHWIAVGLLATAPLPAQAQSISGPAEAVDGDTLSLTGMRVRLLGIDAPEAQQTCERGGSSWACGEDARARLAELVDGKNVSCSGQETDPYGRLVAICRAGSTDIGGAMVAAGLATAFTKYSNSYVETESRARELKLGLWSSSFEEPAKWREAHPEQQPKAKRPVRHAAPAAARIYRDSLGRCAIKGNHSRKGEWIYHLPGQPYYNETRPEAWFCTEEAAQGAGYRPSRAR